jgi:hypothetical protein
MNLIEERTEEFVSWQTSQNITEKTATSSININDEVELSHDFNDYGDSIWDDCDQVTTSFRNLTDYKFFNFPFDISTVFLKQGEENGFEFSIQVNSRNYKYDFFRDNFSSGSHFEKLQNVEINNILYPEILKINILGEINENDIKTIFLVKEDGIVQIVLYNGIVVNLNDL